MKETMLYKQLPENKAKCNLFGRRCTIPEGSAGSCLVGRKEKEKLYSFVYGKAYSACLDPMTKKPFSHFHPGSLVMSRATVGCNFSYRFCDNWSVNQEKKMKGYPFIPEKVVETTKENGCQGISCTYTEPTIFFKYVYDEAMLAHNACIHAASSEVGLNYVYMGNVPGHRYENTYCPKCPDLLIKRLGFEIEKWRLAKDMRCPACRHTIAVKGQSNLGVFSYPYTLV